MLTGVAKILKNDGVIANFDADDIIAHADLLYFSILNTTATADGEVTVTVVDSRQIPETGTLTVVNLSSLNFTITRYRQLVETL